MLETVSNMTNQRSVSWAVLDRYFGIIINGHENDDYEEEDYYDYIVNLIRKKHCDTCRGNFGCNYCSLYVIVG